ncbi:hypothetical protein [Clostridium sp.]|uniref:hypothetical protein n=1 Tax=Clostridium sp. TaxID=1506 RepID=UPI002634E53B|nr:hypothetical protein [Clostridium sp.]
MKKKLLIVLVTAIFGLQLVGCSNSVENTRDNTVNKEVTSDSKNVVHNDGLTEDLADVYLDIREEYLEVTKDKDMNDWNEAKREAYDDLNKIKARATKEDNNINQSINDIEELITKYQNNLDGKMKDLTEIQNLEGKIKKILFNK